MKKVMVVDFDPDVVTIFEDSLTKMGYSTLNYTSAETCLESLKVSTPALIIIGVFSDKQKLLKALQNKKVKLLYVSAGREVMLHDAANVLETPFDEGTLLKKVKGLIG
jgi:DNA-binding NtrC family response regulator